MLPHECGNASGCGNQGLEIFYADVSFFHMQPIV